MVFDAVCFSVGTLIDQWLFWQMSTTGACHRPAKVIAPWKSGWLVAPSPMNPTVTTSSPRRFAAHAAPTACGICGPMQEDQATWLTLRPDMWLGICRPLSTSRVVAVDLRQPGGEREAAREHDRALAQGREDPVALLQRERGGDRRRLLAGDRAEEADLALPLFAEHALVEAPDAQERPVHVQKRLVREERVRIGVGRAVVANHASQAQRGILAQGLHHGGRILSAPPDGSMRDAARNPCRASGTPFPGGFSFPAVVSKSCTVVNARECTNVAEPETPAEEETVATSIDEVEIEIEVEPEPSGRAELSPIARLGRYELLGRMAVGGMAEIFLARERARAGSSREVVVKVMRPQLVGDAEHAAMFDNEGRVALRLQHPNICHVYELGLEHGRRYLAMEHVHGVTLRELTRRAAVRGERVPVPILARVVAHVAEALHAAHGATDADGRLLGIVHRDVSPHNVMVGFDGVVKLLDFGVAHVRSGTPFAERSGTIVGKFGYLAPEQCLGRPVDARTDVFALGVCLWEGLTGQRLFRRDTDYAGLQAIVHEDAPDPAQLCVEVPERLSSIALRALARDPAMRFSSAAAMQDALEQYLVDQRERVGTARVRRYVEHLFGERACVRPELDRDPETVAWIGPEDEDGSPRAILRPLWFPVFGAAALLAGAVAGLYVWVTHRPEPPVAVVEVPRPASSAPPARPVEPPPPPVVVPALAPVEAPAPSVADERPAHRQHERPRPGGFVEDPGF